MARHLYSAFEIHVPSDNVLHGFVLSHVVHLNWCNKSDFRMFATCNRYFRNNTSRRRRTKGCPGKPSAPPRTRRPTAGIFRRRGSSKRGTGSCSTISARRSATDVHNSVRDFKEPFYAVADYKTESLHFRACNGTKKGRRVDGRAGTFLRIGQHRSHDTMCPSTLL